MQEIRNADFGMDGEALGYGEKGTANVWADTIRPRRVRFMWCTIVRLTVDRATSQGRPYLVLERHFAFTLSTHVPPLDLSASNQL